MKIAKAMICRIGADCGDACARSRSAPPSGYLVRRASELPAPRCARNRQNGAVLAPIRAKGHPVHKYNTSEYLLVIVAASTGAILQSPDKRRN
jgi:hypothetical protein